MLGSFCNSCDVLMRVTIEGHRCNPSLILLELELSWSEKIHPLRIVCASLYNLHFYMEYPSESATVSDISFLRKRKLSLTQS